MAGEIKYLNAYVDLRENFDPKNPEHLRELFDGLAHDIGWGIVQKLFEFNKISYDREAQQAGLSLGVKIPETPPEEHQLNTRDFGIEQYRKVYGHFREAGGLIDFLLGAGAG